MPYITKERRFAFAPLVEAARVARLDTTGELNFALTSLCREFLAQHGISYRTFNEIVGALECAKIELYRRQIASYEDSKLSQNGDVWGGE